jgi:hypothetical protein
MDSASMFEVTRSGGLLISERPTMRGLQTDPRIGGGCLHVSHDADHFHALLPPPLFFAAGTPRRVDKGIITGLSGPPGAGMYACGAIGHACLRDSGTFLRAARLEDGTRKSRTLQGARNPVCELPSPTSVLWISRA